MNFYLIEKTGEKNPPELLQTVKEFLREHLPGGAIEDPVLKLAYDGENPFFLKTPAGIVWGKVLEETLAADGLPGLRHDLEYVLQMFRQKIRFYIFAPDYEPGLNLGSLVSQETAFFEYFFLRARSGQGMGLREWKAAGLEPAVLNRTKESSVPCLTPSSNVFKNAKLNREELSELINLSLELKSCGAASPSSPPVSFGY